MGAYGELRATEEPTLCRALSFSLLKKLTASTSQSRREPTSAGYLGFRVSGLGDQ